MGSYKFGKQAVAAKEQSRTRTMWKVAFITLLLLIPFVIYIVLTTLPPNPVMGKTIDKGVFDPFTTIKTDWFSFRVEKTWQAVPELTKENQVYSYREMQGANPQGLLRIYVNSTPVGTESYFSRVVPVVIKEGRTIDAKDMQPDCSDSTKDKSLQGYIVSQSNTKFLCWAGVSLIYAVAGEIGDDSTITMTRENGTTANYVLTYRNLAFSANESSFSKVLETFKSL